jgi:hypothetical protein
MTPFARTGLKVAGAVVVMLGCFGAGSLSNPAKEVAPASCLKSMDLQNQIIGYSSEALGYATDSMYAVASLDASSINAATRKIEALSPKIEALTPQLDASLKECFSKEKK